MLIKYNPLETFTPILSSTFKSMLHIECREILITYASSQKPLSPDVVVMSTPATNSRSPDSNVCPEAGYHSKVYVVYLSLSS